jgi:uncharacterized protein (DUF2249 family)
MAGPPEEILIDARWLEPPEPLERVTPALAGLARGQLLRLLLHREPFPLYAQLRAQGFVHETLPQADGTFVILIHHAG